MRKFIEVTGKTEEEALRQALAQLNLDRDDVSVEILERAKSGFLGFGGCPAKLRVSYGPEEEEVLETSAPVVVEEKPQRTERPVREEKPAREEKKPVRERSERPAREEKPQRERVERPRQEESLPVQDLGEEVDDEKAQAIRTFLDGLFQHMEIEAEVKVYQPEKGRYKVILEGSNMGGVIGRRGETLDAIQQLTSYSVNRGGGGRVRIQLDAENYRAKREQSLEHLAHKVAGKVLKYHRSMTLEPMNAYERHVIHTALQDVEGVTTYSTGTEPNRRVIVACERDSH